MGLNLGRSDMRVSSRWYRRAFLQDRNLEIMSHRPRILAVDDTSDTLELIRMSLKEEYDVMTLSDPMNVYEYIELFQPDLLVLDVMMPRITGFQLTEMLQRNPATRALPVIILSAKDSARDIKHGYKLGASLYLTKPFLPERLAKNVKTQFEMHPPAMRNRALSLGQVLNQLHGREEFREGTCEIASKVFDEMEEDGSNDEHLRDLSSRRIRRREA